MSFMPVTGPELSHCPEAPYGWLRRFRQIAVSCLVLLVAAAAAPAIAQQNTSQQPVHIVALGDSLTAGLGLPLKYSFVQRLQTALAAQGAAVEIANAGVSGDTASDGLARLDWSVPDGTDAVIVELGANDMLRGLKPEMTRAALDMILQRLTARHIAVLLCGMRAAPNLGADYVSSFESVYPALAAKYRTLLYPFFLDGVAGNLSLLQGDGLHPNAAGVDVIVQRILPKVEALVAQFRGQKPS
jgi:acyl-CoA thioesterase I